MYYSQTLLEGCKYEIKKNKMENPVNDDLDPSSSDNESDNESNNIIEIGIEKGPLPSPAVLWVVSVRERNPW